MYAEGIMDHYRNPRNMGEMDRPDYEGAAGNPRCGDRVRFFLRSKKGIVEQAKFEGHGCAISMAFASMLTQDCIGKSISELKNMGGEEFLNTHSRGLEGSRKDCATTGFRALKKALEKGKVMY